MTFPNDVVEIVIGREMGPVLGLVDVTKQFSFLIGWPTLEALVIGPTDSAQ